jgi:chromosome segregation ATPase
LDQLGYRQPLGIETVPLVERLFSDLVHTTESLKNTKSQLAEKRQEGAIVGEQVEPYKADNAKLVKEVNQLHMELVRRKDNADAQIKKMRSTLRDVEHENADLKFLNTQYAHKLRAQEQEGELKAERIQRLLEKNLEAVVETADGKKQSIATRRQRMELKSLVHPADPREIAPQLMGPAVGQHQVDLLQLADAKVAGLEDQLQAMRDDKGLIDTQLATLQAQVQRREDEIERMGRLLEGGRPVSSVMADGHSRNEERKLATLENQVEYLQQTKKALESELSVVSANNEELALHVEEMQSKNATMVRELSEFDRLSRELQQEKLAAKADSVKEIRKEKEKLQRQQENIADRLTSVQTMEHDAARLEGENAHLAGGLSKAEREIERLQAEVDRTADDHKRLIARCQRLEQREKQLAAQLRRSGRDPATFVQTAGAPGGMVFGAAPTNSSVGSDVGNKGGVGGGGGDPEITQTISNLQNELHTLEEANRSLQQVFSSVEQERDYFKHEATRASLSRSTRLPQQAPRSAEPKAQEIQRYQAESKSLAEMVKGLELQLHQATSELTWLRAEHAKVRASHQHALDKSTLRRNQGSAPNSPSRSARGGGGGSGLNSSLARSQQQQVINTDQQQQQQQGLQRDLRLALGDRQTLEGNVAELSTALEQARLRLDQSQRETVAATTKAGHLESLLLTSMGSGNAPQHGGSGLIGDEAEREIAALTGELQVMVHRCSKAEAECNALRQTLQSLHADRDVLVAEADQQSVTIHQLRMQMQTRDAEANQGDATFQASQAEVSALQSRLLERNEQLGRLQEQVTSVEEERDDVRTNAAGLDSQIRGAHLDLDNMTREHQAVHTEYHQALKSKAEMERELENTSSRCDVLDRMLQEKSAENSDLQESVSRASTANQEATGMVARLHAQQSEIQQLSHQLEEANSTRLQHDQRQQELEGTEAALRVEIAQLEEMVAGGGSGGGARDVGDDAVVPAAVADEQLAQLVELEAHNSRLSSNLHEMKLSMEDQSRQSDAESDRMRELEDLLADSRGEHAQADTASQKLAAENTALCQSVQELTRKYGAVMRDMNSLQDAKTRADETNAELRHALQNHKFEALVAIRQQQQGHSVGGERGERGGDVGGGGGGGVGGGRSGSSRGAGAATPPSRG